MTNIAVTHEGGIEAAVKAENLAIRLNLPLAGSPPGNIPYLLVFTDDRLELRQTGQKLPGPLYADFLSGTFRYRLDKGGGARQHLARAVGIKGIYRPTIFDATAGLGRDGFILAALGCRVTMAERSPLIAALLEDALARAASDALTAEIVRPRIKIVVGDSINLLQNLDEAERPETVYLDPMYPHRTKSALVKKEMRYLRALVGDDEDAALLLERAIAAALKRVAVKRPRLAPAIPGPVPTSVIKGKNSRYDIYSCVQNPANP